MTAQVQGLLVRTRPMSSGEHAVLEIQKLLAAGLPAACTLFHGVVRAAAGLVHNWHVELDIIVATSTGDVAVRQGRRAMPVRRERG